MLVLGIPLRFLDAEPFGSWLSEVRNSLVERSLADLGWVRRTELLGPTYHPWSLGRCSLEGSWKFWAVGTWKSLRRMVMISKVLDDFQQVDGLLAAFDPKIIKVVFPRSGGGALADVSIGKEGASRGSP